MHSHLQIFILLIFLLHNLTAKPKMPKMTPEEDPTLSSQILAEEQMKVCKQDIYCTDIHDQMTEIRSKECLGSESDCFKYQVKFARMLHRLCYFFNKEIENVDEMCADGVSQHIIYGPAKCQTCSKNKDHALKNEFNNPNKEFFNMLFENKLLNPQQMALCVVNKECDKIEEKIEGLVENLCSGSFEECVKSYKQILFEECEISKILLGHSKECVNMNKYYAFDHDLCSVCSEIKSKEKRENKEPEKVEL